MTAQIRLESPFLESDIERLTAGSLVLISGIIYTARDAAHKKMVECLERGEDLPVELAGQTLYYMGPTPARPGSIIGSCGPTTSGRMDGYTARLLETGLRSMIGKGARSGAVKAAMVAHRAIYLVTYGGAGALLSRRVKKAMVAGYPELGAEAIMRLEVENFPALLVNDIYGADLFESERAKYASTGER